jgi:hypothetical protein
MSRARNLADLLDASGDVVSGALDNVPPSNDASALTTGTLPIARIADGDITAAKLGSTLDLSGKTVTLPAGGTGYGKVLQVVSAAVNGGGWYTGSTSYSDITGLSLSITPSSSSSKVLVFGFLGRGNVFSADSMHLALVRNSTKIANALKFEANNSSSVQISAPMSISWLDSPNTTSATTYKLQGKVGASGTAYFIDGFSCSIIAMEIAG